MTVNRKVSGKTISIPVGFLQRGMVILIFTLVCTAIISWLRSVSQRDGRSIEAGRTGLRE